jgi:hypothetical protein
MAPAARVRLLAGCLPRSARERNLMILFSGIAFFAFRSALTTVFLGEGSSVVPRGQHEGSPPVPRGQHVQVSGSNGATRTGDHDVNSVGVVSDGVAKETADVNDVAGVLRYVARQPSVDPAGGGAEGRHRVADDAHTHSNGDPADANADKEKVLSHVRCPAGSTLDSIGTLLVVTRARGAAPTTATRGSWWKDGAHKMCWVELTAEVAGWEGCDTHEPDFCVLHFLSRAHAALPRWVVIASSEELGWMESVPKDIIFHHVPTEEKRPEFLPLPSAFVRPTSLNPGTYFAKRQLLDAVTEVCALRCPFARFVLASTRFSLPSSRCIGTVLIQSILHMSATHNRCMPPDAATTVPPPTHPPARAHIHHRSTHTRTHTHTHHRSTHTRTGVG